MKEPRYGNWISSKLVAASLAAAFALLIGARLAVGHSRLLVGVLLAATLIAMAAAMYLLPCRTALSYEGGGVQGRVLDGVLDALDGAGWDGRGRLLDIGCGSGALTIACAKRNPQGKMVGIDRWGKEYASFTLPLCEKNAAAEGVKNALFRRGNAVKLDFPDESFDAVTSNYVYHNITGKDKQQLLLETLRVLKKGGTFAIHDLMSPGRYGDMQAFVQKLRDMGYERVELIDTTDGSFMTPKEAKRLMLRGSTLLVGRK